MAENSNDTDIQHRLNYFDGQFLIDRDFIDEQRYHIDRQRRHNRLLHVAGIAGGLLVSEGDSPGQVIVSPGTAIDEEGRQIVLAGPETVVIPEKFFGVRTGAFGENSNPNTVTLCIAYHEEQVAGEAGNPGPTRWLEHPQIAVMSDDDHEVVNGRGSEPDPAPLLLAALTLDPEGVLTEINTEDREYSGLRFPCTDDDKLTLRAVDSGVSLDGSLTVEGATDLHGALTVSGNATFGKREDLPRLRLLGTAEISDDSGYAAQAGKMAPGSLTIGGAARSYGGGSEGWSENTAGLLFETDKHTEIAVYPNSGNLASLMYYEGPEENRITIGRDMGGESGPIKEIVLNGDVRTARLTATEATTLQGTLTIDSEVITLAGGKGVISYGKQGKLGSAKSFAPGKSGDNEYPGLWLEAADRDPGSESAGIFINSDTMCLWSPGDIDGAVLRVYDEDSFHLPPRLTVTQDGDVKAARFLIGHNPADRVFRTGEEEATVSDSSRAMSILKDQPPGAFMVSGPPSNYPELLVFYWKVSDKYYRGWLVAGEEIPASDLLIE